MIFALIHYEFCATLGLFTYSYLYWKSRVSWTYPNPLSRHLPDDESSLMRPRAWLRVMVDARTCIFCEFVKYFSIKFCRTHHNRTGYTFLFRYEIREMIQKIKILQSEQRNNTECQDASVTGIQKYQQIRRYDHNGSVVGVGMQPLLDHRNSDRG